MAQHQPYSSYIENRPKLVSLHVDSTILPASSAEEESIQSSPQSAATTASPTTPLTGRRSSCDSDSADPDDEKEPASGPQRSRSLSNAKADKEKRKRSRVTPEQLVHLERFFSADRSPTAARRREISDLLGMQERQTQIWFQNRRAKAKLQDGKHKGRGGSTETPPDTPPELSTGFEIDLHNLIHEDEPVTIIPCTDLSIGTWRRIATTVGKHDLVAYVCDVKRCLTWFIHSGGFGFKMEIPFESIVDTDFTNAAPGSGLASFMLSQPPVFYLENISSPASDGSTTRTWKRCSDWTEGHQATHVLRHDLIGSAVQLAHVLRNLQTSSSGSEIALHSPSYRGAPTSPMEVPAPPMASLTNPGYHYPEVTADTRSRTYSGPGLSQSVSPMYSPNDHQPPPHTAPAATFPHSSYTAVSNRGTPASSTFGTSVYNEYPQGPVAQPLDDYRHGVPISHGLAPRSYPSQPIPRTFYSDAPRLVQQYSNNDLRRSTSGPSHTVEDSPSLLASQYHHSSPHLTDSHPNSRQHGSPQPIMSGMPGLIYETEDPIPHHSG
ncbi:homeobox-domain-containing protein [Pluteus cervinus]|uniref:Homeobox-domain-containing protein n=1 Tax=Pluteus cervinus TaxID=181527 RepID=A0ACD3AYD2_9AGAR|nr:homeobox-domain-containing protein [Pluteus cervinus]